MEAYWKFSKYRKGVSPPIQCQVLNEYFVMEVSLELALKYKSSIEKYLRF
jgi:hypothetical protein